jgi:UDP-N-acetylglucosamine transferase subunit ALG13
MSKGNNDMIKTIKKAQQKGIQLKTLFDAMALYEKSKELKDQAEMLFKASGVEAYMSLQDQKVAHVFMYKNRSLELMNTHQVRFDQKQLEQDNPTLFAKYKTKIVAQLRKKFI